MEASERTQRDLDSSQEIVSADESENEEAVNEAWDKIDQTETLYDSELVRFALR